MDKQMYGTALQLWAACEPATRRVVYSKLTKHPDDADMDDEGFIKTLFSKVGGKQWLEFTLQKILNVGNADEVSRNRDILKYATVTPSGDNIITVMNNILSAADMCRQGPNRLPEDMICQQLCRAFDSCEVRGVAAEIRTTAVLGPDGVYSTFNVLDLLTEQGDKNDKGHIDWVNRIE